MVHFRVARAGSGSSERVDCRVCFLRPIVTAWRRTRSPWSHTKDSDCGARRRCYVSRRRNSVTLISRRRPLDGRKEEEDARPQSRAEKEGREEGRPKGGEEGGEEGRTREESRPEEGCCACEEGPRTREEGSAEEGPSPQAGTRRSGT